jgi:hypothetical protein
MACRGTALPFFFYLSVLHDIGLFIKWINMQKQNIMVNLNVISHSLCISQCICIFETKLCGLLFVILLEVCSLSLLWNELDWYVACLKSMVINVLVKCTGSNWISMTLWMIQEVLPEERFLYLQKDSFAFKGNNSVWLVLLPWVQSCFTFHIR